MDTGRFYALLDGLRQQLGGPRQLLACLDVPDSKARHDIEAGAIGLLSMHTGDADPPSADWLGLYAYKKEVRNSGLWNVQHTNELYDPSFLDLMEERLRTT